jgi:hypothetical protein
MVFGLVSLSFGLIVLVGLLMQPRPAGIWIAIGFIIVGGAAIWHGIGAFLGRR